MPTYVPVYPPAHNSTYVKATSAYDVYSQPYFATDPTKSVIGAYQDNAWLSSINNSQKFNIDLGISKIIRGFYIENFHISGGFYTAGAYVARLYGTDSAAAFANTDYSNLENLTLIAEFLDPGDYLQMHLANSDAPDPKYKYFDNQTAYRHYILRIQSNFGQAGFLGFRRLALLEDTEYNVVEPIVVALDQPYAILADYIFAICEQLYSFSFPLNTSLDQLYSIVSEVWLTQHYGDVPFISKSLEQPYSWASVIHKSLLQRWGDALQLETSLEQPWTMPDMLQAVSEQSYGITTAILQATCEQLYHINANSTLFANLIQPYALAGEAARLYQFDTRLYVNGERIRYHSLEWQATESEYALSCDFSVKLQADAMKCVDGAEIRITSAGDTYLLKCYGGWFLDKRHGSEVYRVSGYSRTRDLDLAMPLLGDLPAGMASQLVTDLATPFGITVDWQMADGYIEAGKITANDETPLTVIKNIVHDARGIVLSTPAGNLLIVAEEEVPIPDWATVTPVDTIIARLERISTSEQRDEQRGFNFFKVSDQLASGDGYRFEEVSIDAHTKELRLFVTPMNAGRQFALGHSGGVDVSIEPFGIQPLVIVNELVEFKAGSGQTSKPIYKVKVTDSTWQGADLGAVTFPKSAWHETALGAVTFTETGLLTAAVSGYSLLWISYQARYFRWIGRDRNIKHVQFIYYEVTS